MCVCVCQCGCVCVINSTEFEVADRADRSIDSFSIVSDIVIGGGITYTASVLFLS